MTLAVLGLHEHEDRAYRALVTLPSASAPHLADMLGLDLSAVDLALAALERRGLAARSGASPDQFVASPPDVALGALLLQHEEQTRRAQAEILELGQMYREAAPRRSGDVVDVVRGPDAVRHRFNQLQRAARNEVLEFVRGDIVAVSREENVEEERAINRGVRYRFVLERDTLERPGILEAVHDTIARGAEVRATRSLPTRLIVVDGELAMIPLAASTGDQSGGALLLHAGGLLDMAMALFERTWRDAVVLGGPDASDDSVPDDFNDVLTELERQVLDLLNAGFTDRTIASRLGVSQRTVQRNVQSLMYRADADTRLQLGVQAVLRGWLGRGDQRSTSRDFTSSA